MSSRSNTLGGIVTCASGGGLERVRAIGEVLEPSLRYHEGPAAAMVLGQAAAGLNGLSSCVAKAEISALWNAISKHPSLRKRRT